MMAEPVDFKARAGLPEHPEPELAQYRPLCLTAIVALGVGLLSVTAFAYPLLWSLPLAGVVLAAIALRQIRAAPQPLVGRGMALAGLFLSLSFGVAAPTQKLTHDYWLSARAERLADLFLDRLATDPRAAYQLTFRAHQKAPPPDRGANGQPPEKPKPDFESFLGENLVAKLIKLGKTSERRHLGTEMTVQEGVVQHFYVTYECASSDDAAHPLRFYIHEQRTILSHGDENWFVLALTKMPTSALEPQ